MVRNRYARYNAQAVYDRQTGRVYTAPKLVQTLNSMSKRVEELEAERDRLSACYNNGLDPELLDRIPDLDLENMTLSLECDELERTNARLRGAFNALHQQNGRLLEKEKELCEQRDRLYEAMDRIHGLALADEPRDTPRKLFDLATIAEITREVLHRKEASDD